MIDKRNKILLHSRVEAETQPHQIRLRDPNFDEDPITGWSWISGSGWNVTTDGYAEHVPNGVVYSLHQNFGSPISNGMYYRVSVQALTHVTGTLYVRMGAEVVGAITGSGLYDFSYYSTSGVSLATVIRFVPSGDYEGRITGVRILQDTTLSPLDGTISYEPSGYLDLYENEDLELSYEVNDVSDITARLGAYSKTFRIPANGQNRRMLGHLYEGGMNPKIYDPRNKTAAILLSEEVPALKGFMSLKEVIIEDDLVEYEIELYDDSLGLLDKLKNKKITDLNLDDITHTLKISNILGSWNASRSWTNGWGPYPLYHLGEGVIRTVNDHFRPTFYKRYILDRVMQEAGFSYDLSPAVEEKINRLLMAPVGKKPKPDEADLESLKVIASGDSATVWTTEPLIWNSNTIGYDLVGGITFNAHTAVLGVPYFAAIPVETEVQDNNGQWQDAQWEYTAFMDGEHRVELNVNCDISIIQPEIDFFPGYRYMISEVSLPAESLFRVELYDVDTGAILDISAPFYMPETLYDGATNWTNQIFSINGNYHLTTGQRIKARIYMRNHMAYRNGDNSQYNWGHGTTFRSALNSVSFEAYPSGIDQVGEHMNILAKNWLPSAGQDQFLEDLIRLFNLFLIKDRYNPKMIHFVSHGELYGTNKVIDHSGKVDMSSRTVKWLTDVSASKLKLGYAKFNESGDIYNENYFDRHRLQYGDHEFNYRTDLLTDEQENRLSIYTPCPIMHDGSKFIPAVSAMGEGSECKLLMQGTAKYEVDEFKIRYTASNSPIQLLHDEYLPTLHVNDPFSGTVDINFGKIASVMGNEQLRVPQNNLFNDHYRNQLEQFRDKALHTVYMRLSIADVHEHLENLGARIWIAELNSYFTLYSLHYDPMQGERQLAKVELLECGPQIKRMDVHGTYLVGPAPIPPSKDLRSIGLGGSKADETSIIVGPNVVNGGSYNWVSGGDNTVWAHNNLTIGTGNTINATANNTLVIGNDMIATEPDSIYISNHTHLGPTSATFYSSTTINQNGIVTPWLVSSGLTVQEGSISALTSTTIVSSSISASTVSATTITIGGVTFNAGNLSPQDLQSVLDVGEYAAGKSIHLEGGGVFASHSHTWDGVGRGNGIIGGTENLLTTSEYSVLVGGVANTIGSAAYCTIIGSDSSTVEDSAERSSVIGSKSTIFSRAVGCVGLSTLSSTFGSVNDSTILASSAVELDNGQNNVVLLGMTEVIDDDIDLDFCAYADNLKVRYGLFYQGTTIEEWVAMNAGVLGVFAGSNLSTTGGATPTLSLQPNINVTSITATTYYSGSTPLTDIIHNIASSYSGTSSGGSGSVISVGAVGPNLSTGGTATDPTIAISDNPIFSSVTATTIHSDTLFTLSGGFPTNVGGTFEDIYGDLGGLQSQITDVDTALTAVTGSTGTTFTIGETVRLINLRGLLTSEGSANSNHMHNVMNLPAVAAFFPTIWPVPINGARYDRVKFRSHLSGAFTVHSGTKLILKYVPVSAYTSTVGDWLTLGTSEVEVTFTAVGQIQTTGWIPLVSGAKEEILIRVLTQDGNGVADPCWLSIDAEFEKDITMLSPFS